MAQTTSVAIKPPNFQTAIFPIIGTAPLVIHRFSAKTKEEMKQKMETGKASSSKKNREAKSTDDLFAAITPRLAEMQNPNDVHFNAKGYDFLGQKVAEEITKVLAAR